RGRRADVLAAVIERRRGARSRRRQGERIALRAALAVALAAVWILAAWHVGAATTPPAHRMPSESQIASTFAVTAASIAIGRPHARVVSPGHLFVASMPILPPRPATGEAKSR